MKLIELKLLIPQERTTDFYIQFAAWNRTVHRPAPPQSPPNRKSGSNHATSRSTASRYQAMATFFENAPEKLTLTISQIEEVIGGRLPESARKYRAWWSNTDRNSQARTWLNHGYIVVGVDYDNERIEFNRLQGSNT